MFNLKYFTFTNKILLHKLFYFIRYFEFLLNMCTESKIIYKNYKTYSDYEIVCTIL